MADLAMRVWAHRNATPAAAVRTRSKPGLLARAFVGEHDDELSVATVLSVDVHTAMLALGRVSGRAPFFLEPTALEGDVRRGGTLVFRVPRTAAAMIASPLAQSGLRDVHVDVVSALQGTRVTVRAPLGVGAREHQIAGTIIAVPVVALGSGLCAAACKVALGIVGAALGAPFALGSAVLLPLAALTSRAAFGSWQRHAHARLQELVQAIELDVRLEGAFTPAPTHLASVDDGATESALAAIVGL